MGTTAIKKPRGKPADQTDPHTNIVRRKVFSVEDLLKHNDPGPREEAEEFARLAYEQRRQDRERTLPE